MVSLMTRLPIYLCTSLRIPSTNIKNEFLSTLILPSAPYIGYLLVHSKTIKFYLRTRYFRDLMKKLSSLILPPRCYTIFFRTTNIPSFPDKPIPISTSGSLHSVNLHIGCPEDDENRIRMRFDTGVAMNMGSLEYHL